MTATLLLIRHAAHGHLDRCLSGRMPGVPLSEAGRDQALTLARRLAGERIDWIDASPLDRTRETAAAIAGPHGLTPEDAPDLVEIDMGDWTGRAFDTLTDDPDWTRWNQERGIARIPGGETMAEAQARIMAHLRRIARERTGTIGALVTHSDMIRGAVADILGLSLDHVLRFDIDPASVTRVVMGDWGARLLTLNETAG
ncbi:histidine phosphatase family protein [Sphingomonas sp. S-NIH.Pt15_0812]|uniref:histidine phosphatase family protein n=1 Tax=Sphingomonas sp. S-NIH.Pt15_0812 TaxID=1920129 RepID=UPI000F7DCA3A|nr:histidine phosphatase family protein [Sphingomonas sp. S-NIH.Pt15_0812]RSU48580.1 histidine phosphatase family protein [Sphingomonas sp. S-NIH.Pt15_0812]